MTTAFFLKKWLEHNTHTNPVVVAGAWSNDCAASQDFNQPQPTHSSLFRVDGGECFGLPLMVGGSDSELVRISRAGSYFCGSRWVLSALTGSRHIRVAPDLSCTFHAMILAPGGPGPGPGPVPATDWPESPRTSLE